MSRHFSGHFVTVSIIIALITYVVVLRTPVDSTSSTPTGRNGDGPDATSPWKPPIVPDHIQNLDQNDPKLIAYIRDHWILPPNSGRVRLDPTTFRNKKRCDFSEQGQVDVVLDILEDRRDGFYVECGAADGQRNSNSLFLELFMNWTGLLIEPDPEFFRELRTKNRNAYLVNACLSTRTKPIVAEFIRAGISSGIGELIPEGQRRRYNMDQRQPISVQCFPLYSILRAISVSRVDYFSLDIEGAEVDVLRTIPFDDVTIDVMSVEKRVIEDERGTEKKERQIVDLLSPYGYELRKRLKMDIILSRFAR